MGLSEKMKEEETKGLQMMGIPTEIKPIDKQIDEYFYSRDKKKKRIVMAPKIASKIDLTAMVVPRLLAVTTRGFKDGILQHNMPCPVCLEEPALYVSNKNGTYFAPCDGCHAVGFSLKKDKVKKGWF